MKGREVRLTAPSGRRRTLEDDADDATVVDAANQNGAVLAVRDCGPDMTEALRKATHGVIVFRIPNFKIGKVLKYYQWFARHLPKTKADCDLTGKVVEASTEGIRILEAGVEVELFPYPEATR